MPGMMETVLNIGVNRATLRGLVRQTGNPRLAEDCRGRLVQQYGEVVRGISPGRFEAALAATLKVRAVETIDEIDTAGMAAIADAFEEVFAAETGEPFPVDPFVQLREAVEAVLRSWSSDRAARYRRLNAIPDDAGTAVTVQAMAFGNRGPESGAGVGFTRNPADGRNELYVDYLPNAQGEDVVAGRRKALGLDELERRAPEAFHALVGARHILETEFCDMEDFEFTVEDGHLQFLQARSGKRTPLAAVRIASDLVEEQLITRDEALARIAALDLDAIDDLRLRVPAGATPIVRGTAAGTGVAVGALVFDPDRLAVVASAGRPVILVRQAAETADIASLAEAAALVTVEGARTSHAAVVARQLGKVCVVACDGLVIDPSGRSARFGTEALNEGDVVSVDGVSGEIYRGALEIDRERPAALLERLALWRAEAAAKRPPQA
jgi:pyruvate,orthophosphate dikinase